MYPKVKNQCPRIFSPAIVRQNSLDILTSARSESIHETGQRKDGTEAAYCCVDRGRPAPPTASPENQRSVHVMHSPYRS